MLRQTQRQYTNYKTKEVYNMYEDVTTHKTYLLNSKTNEPLKAPFYCCAFTDIDLKLKDKTIVTLKMGEFLEIEKGNEPTHKRFFIQNRFKKIIQ